MPKVREAPIEVILDHTDRRRKLPVGAEVIDGRIDFRVGASDRRKMTLIVKEPFNPGVASLKRGAWPKSSAAQ